MLPDRSSTIKASGAVEVVKSASSPVAWAASTAADIKKQQRIPPMNKQNTFAFITPPISTW
jgi:hypothetical protein